MPATASDVHGLTRARLRTMGARPWPAVHAESAQLLEDASSVIAWNAEFDRSMLEQTAERHGLMLPAVPWRCAMQAEADTHGPDTGWSNLEEAAEESVGLAAWGEEKESRGAGGGGIITWGTSRFGDRHGG